MSNDGKIKKSLVIMLKIFLLLVILIPVVGLLPRLITHFYSQNKIYSLENAPNTTVAIIFGAGLLHDGSPTAVLRDRVATAVDLYQSGKVAKLLMSGDNRFSNYNEPGAMADYAHLLGVPYDDIILDYAGRRTYDTCYRAKYIFQVDEAILITQSFHLPRAIYTCGRLGINPFGVLANKRPYSRALYAFWNLREIPATIRAIWDLYIYQPVPVLGSPEPIISPLEHSKPSIKN